MSNRKLRLPAVEIASRRIGALMRRKSMVELSFRATVSAAVPVPEHGGTVTTISFSVISDNPLVELWIDGGYVYGRALE